MKPFKSFIGILLFAICSLSFAPQALAQYPNNGGLEQAAGISLLNTAGTGVGVKDTNSTADTSVVNGSQWIDVSTWKTIGYDVASDSTCKVDLKFQFKSNGGEVVPNVYADSLINTGTTSSIVQRYLQGYSSSSTVTVPKGMALVRAIATFRSSGNPAGAYKFYWFLWGITQ
jgi:hypothetical protein